MRVFPSFEIIRLEIIVLENIQNCILFARQTNKNENEINVSSILTNIFYYENIEFLDAKLLNCFFHFLFLLYLFYRYASELAKKRKMRKNIDKK